MHAPIHTSRATAVEMTVRQDGTWTHCFFTSHEPRKVIASVTVDPLDPRDEYLRREGISTYTVEARTETLSAFDFELLIEWLGGFLYEHNQDIRFQLRMAARDEARRKVKEWPRPVDPDAEYALGEWVKLAARLNR